VRAAAAALLAIAAPSSAGASPLPGTGPLPGASEIPGAVIVLEAAPGTPGSDPSAAPPRFALFKDRQVFVGGTARLEAGRLGNDEASALLKRAEAVRKLPGFAPAGTSSVSLGGDATRTVRLRLLDGKPLEVVATGDPAVAPAALAPLATLLVDLLQYHHASLRPYAPSAYALAVREARLVGGCRAWGFAFPIAQAIAAPHAVSAAEAVGWPTGAFPASVCADDPGPPARAGRHYVVTLRPLLPGEQP
jgi:hypothetical protein